jgi:hypothetical protein
MEYTHITREVYDEEGGFDQVEYRWHWAKDESGKWIEVEELSEGEWFEYDGFEKKSDLTRWIKENETENRKIRKMLESEAKHNAKIAKIDALMEQGMEEEQAEAEVENDWLASIESEIDAAITEKEQQDKQEREEFLARIEAMV